MLQDLGRTQYNVVKNGPTSRDMHLGYTLSSAVKKFKSMEKSLYTNMFQQPSKGRPI